MSERVREAADVVIVGGGVIGLSIAYALADAGIQAAILDRGPYRASASWAGAGMIAPPSRPDVTDPLARLRTASAHLHREWAASLLEQTGIDNGYRRCGGVDIAARVKDLARLQAASRLWQAEGIAFQPLDPADLWDLEPTLSRRIKGAYLLPERAQIRNPWHLRALEAACLSRGVTIDRAAAVEGFEVSGSRVAAVHTSAGKTVCGQVVLAAGAWTGGLAGGLGSALETPPWRGQLVLLNARGPVPRRIVEEGSFYLVPRGEGLILAGATMEAAGFDPRPTAAGTRLLLDAAFRLCPALADAAIERTWAGLRPGGIDSRPMIGRLPNYENVIVATGHNRAGLTLSTGTAVAVAALIRDGAAAAHLAGFEPGRAPIKSPAPAAFRS